MTPKPKVKTHPHGSGPTTPHPHPTTPNTPHAKIPAATSLQSFQASVQTVLTKGRPTGTQPAPQANAQTTTPQQVATPHLPPKPTAPPRVDDMHHTPRSVKHILDGEGNSKGGHQAGFGVPKKMEFPYGWGRIKILDATHQVTQNTQPVNGPKLVKDPATNTERYAYDYVGTVDGVQIKVHVYADGEIYSAYPQGGTGVVKNDASPTVSNLPPSTSPRFGRADVGGDNTWVWEGRRGDQLVRVTTDPNGVRVHQDEILGTWQGNKFIPTPKQ
ncbi:hypothetical protein [Lentzea sp. NPDC051838]|uniref:hypothetical protein n=1 Tax=Lentzea sp. NPDC051838 TaxID=3154849 RepID=UPI00343F1E02